MDKDNKSKKEASPEKGSGGRASATSRPANEETARTPAANPPAALLNAEEGITKSLSKTEEARDNTRFIGGPGGPVIVRLPPRPTSHRQDGPVVVGSVTGKKELLEETRLLKELAQQQAQASTASPEGDDAGACPAPTGSHPEEESRQQPANGASNNNPSSNNAPNPPSLQRLGRVTTPDLPPGAYAMQPAGTSTNVELPAVEDTSAMFRAEDSASGLWDITGRSSVNREGLAVANPIFENSTFFSTLPRARNMNAAGGANTSQQDGKIRQARTNMLLAVLLLIVVAMIVAAALYPSGTAAAEEAPTGAPSGMPSQAPTSLDESILSLLPVETTTKILEDPESAQAMAFDWLLEDSDNLPLLTNERILQKFILATLYFATNGDAWRFKMGWLNHSIHECQWFTMPEFSMKSFVTQLYPRFLQDVQPPAGGICSNNDTGLFHHLWLDQNHLVGSLPVELFLLTSLRSFSASFNGLQGPIPSHVGQLTALEGLSISNMQGGGSIPSEIGLLTQLETIVLFGNNHQGQVPMELWTQLTNLETLSLAVNLGLQGQIPTEIGNISNLKWLDLGDADISGTLPSEIGVLSHLEWFGMHENSFLGQIPTEIGLISNIIQFTLFRNMLEGTIPSEIGLLTASTVLSLRDNELTGTVPSELGLLTDLIISLVLRNNHLSGQIPSEFGLLSNLREISMENNTLSGIIPFELEQLNEQQPSILHSLKLDGNPLLSGVVPEGICNLTGTCIANNYDPCEEPFGLIIDCTSMLCGCECPC